MMKEEWTITSDLDPRDQPRFQIVVNYENFARPLKVAFFNPCVPRDVVEEIQDFLQKRLQEKVAGIVRNADRYSRRGY